MDCRFRGYDGHSDRVSSRPHFGHSRTDAPTSIIPAHPRASTPTSVMHAQTIRRSREGGNPSPTRSRTPTPVVPAQAGIHPQHAGTPKHPSFPRRRESIPNTPRHPQTPVVPAQAGIHPQHAATPKHPSFPPRHPNIRHARRHPTSVVPAKGDLCVTPVAGDSVAEMPSIPSREPPALDSRLRGNDGCLTVVQRSPKAGIHPQHAAPPNIRRSRAGTPHPSCPRKETFA